MTPTRLRQSLLLLVALTALLTSLRARHDALHNLAVLVLPGSLAGSLALGGAALGLLLLVAMMAALPRLSWRWWPLLALLGLGVAASDAWVGAMNGVVLSMLADVGAEEVAALTAAELPPLDLFLNPNAYALVSEDGQEIPMDLGALPELLRMAAVLYTITTGLAPSALIAFCGHRAWQWEGVR